MSGNLRQTVALKSDAFRFQALKSVQSQTIIKLIVHLYPFRLNLINHCPPCIDDRWKRNRAIDQGENWMITHKGVSLTNRNGQHDANARRVTLLTGRQYYNPFECILLRQYVKRDECVISQMTLRHRWCEYGYRSNGIDTIFDNTWWMRQRLSRQTTALRRRLRMVTAVIFAKASLLFNWSLLSHIMRIPSKVHDFPPLVEAGSYW